GGIVLEDADTETQPRQHTAVPLGVTLGQVVVYGNEVSPPTLEGIQVQGQRCDQRLAFACRHFRDLALMEHGGAQDLYVECPLPYEAADALPHDGERFRHKVIEDLFSLESFPEFSGFSPKLVVREGRDFRLEVVHVAGNRPQLLDLAFISA